MKIEDLRFDDTAIRLIMNLALKVELSSGLRYRAARKLEDLINLASLSQKNQNDEIKEAFQQLISYLNPFQLDFFRKSGIDTSFNEEPKSQNAPIQSTDTPNTAGKRKLVYRGQVQWV